MMNDWEARMYDPEAFAPPDTMMDSVRGWASVVGARHPDRAWLAHDLDIWVENPHFVGPRPPHPEMED